MLQIVQDDVFIRIKFSVEIRVWGNKINMKFVLNVNLNSGFGVFQKPTHLNIQLVLGYG